MSETEHVKGTAVMFEGDAEANAKAEWLKIGNDEVLKSYYDSFLEALTDTYYNEYVVASGKLFSVKKVDVDPYSDVVNVNRNSDGSYSFEFRYYNGGTCFREMFEDHVSVVD